MPGKPRAQGYSDYYNQNSSVPGNNDNSNLSKDDSVDDAAKRRKEAVQRRLRMRKAGK